MNVMPAKQVLSVALCFALIAFTMPIEADAVMLYQSAPPASEPSTGSSGYPGQGAPQTAEELQSLVAPIALYPDALVAQILSAATFPDQVAVANYWVEQNKSLTGNALMQAVNKQTWDPSVKALTQFPSVLNNMAQNLTWTSQLGEAYHNQQADVMTAIQTFAPRPRLPAISSPVRRSRWCSRRRRPSLYNRPIPRWCMSRNTTPRSFTAHLMWFLPMWLLPTVLPTWWRPACFRLEPEWRSAR